MRFVVECLGKIEKGAPRPGDGAPVVRLHCSGTRLDVTGDRVEPGLLEKMAEQAKAGTVKLLENHGSSFPVGYSYDSEIVERPGENGAAPSRELFVDFWLDMKHPMTPVILSQVGDGYAAQCSIGINEKPKTELRADRESGGLTRYLLDGNFDHVAFTRPGEAAYQYADIDAITAKTIGDAETIYKTSRATGDKGEPMNDALKAKIAERAAMREANKAKLAAGEFAKTDASSACKTAVEHCKAIKEVADMMGADEGATADDLRAVVADLAAEVEAMESALMSHVMAPAETAHPVEAVKADGEEMAKPPEMTPAAPAPSEEKLPHPVPLPGPGPIPPPGPGPGPGPAPAASAGGLGPAPSSTPPAPPVAAPDTHKEEPVEMSASMKSLSENMSKLLEINKALADRLAKVEAAPDFRNAPARYLTASPSGPDLFGGMSPRDRDTASRHAASDALAGVISGRRR